MDFLINELPPLLIAVVAVYIAVLFTLRYWRKPRKRAMIEHKLGKVKTGERWQVHDTAKNDLAGRLLVRAGDTVTWTVDDSNVRATLSFPSIVFEEINIEEVDRYASAGNPLTLRVSSKAPKGRYPYAVILDGQCAEGGSHTEVEVDDW